MLCSRDTFGVYLRSHRSTVVIHDAGFAIEYRYVVAGDITGITDSLEYFRSHGMGDALDLLVGCHEPEWEHQRLLDLLPILELVDCHPHDSNIGLLHDVTQV